MSDKLIVTSLRGLDLKEASGGIFLIENDNKIKIKKVFTGSCRGIVFKDNKYYVLLDRVLVIFNKEFKELDRVYLEYKIKQNRLKDIKMDLHGICNYKGYWYIVESFHNAIGIYNKKFKREDEIRISDYNVDRHHFNDIFINRNYLLLSMISLSGPGNKTNREKKDGGIIKFSLNNNSLMETPIKDVKHPHSINYYQGHYYYCGSWQNTLQKDNNIVYQANAYTRGLAITDNKIYLGQSKVRYGENQAGCGIHVLDHKYNLLNFIELPTAEIYSILVDNNWQI